MAGSEDEKLRELANIDMTRRQFRALKYVTLRRIAVTCAQTCNACSPGKWLMDESINYYIEVRYNDILIPNHVASN
jgi:hypothetical protein